MGKTACRLGEWSFSLGDSQCGCEQNAAGDVPTGRARGQGKGEDQGPQHDSRTATAHPHLGGRQDGHCPQTVLGWMKKWGLHLDGWWDGHSPSTP